MMRVALFISCLTDLFFPEVGEDVVKILRRVGVPVTFPPAQTCCGQPALNSGFKHEARTLARHFIQVFEDAEVIVTPSGSCATMVRLEYPRLFEDNPAWQARAQAVAARTFEFSEFLVRILKLEDVGARWSSRSMDVPIRVTYHDACHAYRSLGIHAEPRRLLRHVRGLELVEMDRPDWCCGFGGSFSVRLPDISGAMLDEKIRRIKATGVNTVVTTDAGCIMHLAGGLKQRGEAVQVLHLARMLAHE